MGDKESAEGQNSPKASLRAILGRVRRRNVLEASAPLPVPQISGNFALNRDERQLRAGETLVDNFPLDVPPEDRRFPFAVQSAPGRLGMGSPDPDLYEGRLQRLRSERQGRERSRGVFQGVTGSGSRLPNRSISQRDGNNRSEGEIPAVHEGMQLLPEYIPTLLQNLAAVEASVDACLSPRLRSAAEELVGALHEAAETSLLSRPADRGHSPTASSASASNSFSGVPGPLWQQQQQLQNISTSSPSWMSNASSRSKNLEQVSEMSSPGSNLSSMLPKCVNERKGGGRNDNDGTAPPTPLFQDIVQWSENIQASLRSGGSVGVNLENVGHPMGRFQESGVQVDMSSLMAPPQSEPASMLSVQGETVTQLGSRIVLSRALHLSRSQSAPSVVAHENLLRGEMGGRENSLGGLEPLELPPDPVWLSEIGPPQEQVGAGAEGSAEESVDEFWNIVLNGVRETSEPPSSTPRRVDSLDMPIHEVPASRGTHRQNQLQPSGDDESEFAWVPWIQSVVRSHSNRHDEQMQSIPIDQADLESRRDTPRPSVSSAVDTSKDGEEMQREKRMKGSQDSSSLS